MLACIVCTTGKVYVRRRPMFLFDWSFYIFCAHEYAIVQCRCCIYVADLQTVRARQTSATTRSRHDDSDRRRPDTGGCLSKVQPGQNQEEEERLNSVYDFRPGLTSSHCHATKLNCPSTYTPAACRILIYCQRNAGSTLF